MTALKIVPVLAALAAAAFVTAAFAQTGTQSKQERWALSKPSIYSQGQRARQVCLVYAESFTPSPGGGGRLLHADGFGCTPPYSPLPVHRGGKVIVRTPRAAQAVAIQVPGARPRRCGGQEPGRWLCRMPPPKDHRVARIDIEYRGAESHWEFAICPDPPRDGSACDLRAQIRADLERHRAQLRQRLRRIRAEIHQDRERHRAELRQDLEEMRQRIRS